VLEALGVALVVWPVSLSCPEHSELLSRPPGSLNYRKNKILSSRGQLGGQKGGRRAWTMLSDAQRRKKIKLNGEGLVDRASAQGRSRPRC
jgi:hypothetical protein